MNEIEIVEETRDVLRVYRVKGELNTRWRLTRHRGGKTVGHAEITVSDTVKTEAKWLRDEVTRVLRGRISVDESTGIRPAREAIVGTLGGTLIFVDCNAPEDLVVVHPNFVTALRDLAMQAHAAPSPLADTSIAWERLCARLGLNANE